MYFNTDLRDFCEALENRHVANLFTSSFVNFYRMERSVIIIEFDKVSKYVHIKELVNNVTITEVTICGNVSYTYTLWYIVKGILRKVLGYTIHNISAVVCWNTLLSELIKSVQFKVDSCKSQLMNIRNQYDRTYIEEDMRMNRLLLKDLTFALVEVHL